MLEVVILIYMMSLSFFDLRERKVSAIAVLAGTIVTFTYTAFCLICADFAKEEFGRVLLGAVPGTLLSAVAITTKKAGIADGIILMLLGMLTDYRRGIWIFCFSIMVMAIISIILLVFHRIKKNSELPYLPFLTIAFLASLLWEI